MNSKKNKQINWFFVILFTPIQSILTIVSNNHFALPLIIFLHILLIGMPIFWFLVIDAKRITFKLARKKEILLGVKVGLLLGIVILSFYFLFLKQNFVFNTDIYSNLSPLSFIVFGFLFSFLNSFSEEFNYRYMLFNKLKDLEINENISVLVTGIIFSIHHVLLILPLGSSLLGILTFVTLTFFSCICSCLYQKYDSLYSPYIVHALADLALFIVGFDILFNK